MLPVYYVILGNAFNYNYPSTESINMWRSWHGECVIYWANGLWYWSRGVNNLIPEQQASVYLKILYVISCEALGNALKGEKKSPLQTLKLNYNPGIGDEGVKVLCQGLFTNTTIKVSFHIIYFWCCMSKYAVTLATAFGLLQRNFSWCSFLGATTKYGKKQFTSIESARKFVGRFRSFNIIQRH